MCTEVLFYFNVPPLVSSVFLKSLKSIIQGWAEKDSLKFKAHSVMMESRVTVGPVIEVLEELLVRSIQSETDFTTSLQDVYTAIENRIRLSDASSSRMKSDGSDED